MGHYADRERQSRSGRAVSGRRYGYGGRGYTPRFENDYEGQFDDPAYGRAGDWRSSGYGDRELHERGLGSNAGWEDNERRYGRGYSSQYRNPRETRSPYPDDFGGYGSDYPERRGYERGYETTAGPSKWDYGYPEIDSGPYYGRRGAYSQSDRGWWDRASDEVASWFGDEEAERRRMDDAQGDYRGRGPRGYTRSDDRIEEDINDRLTDHPYIDASNIEVDVSNADVVLTGTVDRRHAKRLAEEVCENVSGVKNVENRIRVNKTDSAGTTTWGASTTEMSSTEIPSRKAATTKP